MIHGSCVAYGVRLMFQLLIVTIVGNGSSIHTIAVKFDTLEQAETAYVQIQKMGPATYRQYATRLY